MQSLFIGLGAVIASALPYLLTNLFHIAGTAAPATSPSPSACRSTLAPQRFSARLLWTILTTKEYPPDAPGRISQTEIGALRFLSGAREILASIRQTPRTMRQLAWVQISYPGLGLFCMWLYFPVAVARNVFGAADTSSPLYPQEQLAALGFCVRLGCGANRAQRRRALPRHCARPWRRRRSAAAARYVVAQRHCARCRIGRGGYRCRLRRSRSDERSARQRGLSPPRRRRALPSRAATGAGQCGRQASERRAMKVELRVNGVSRSADIEPRTTLLDALRENFLLNGAHAGCEHGVCGACTVLIDGEPVRVLPDVRGAGGRLRRSRPSRGLRRRRANSA